MGIIENIDKVMRIFSLAKHQETKDEGTLSGNTCDEYKTRNVLVGVVRNKQQFYSLLKYKFYHIPMAKLENCEMPIKYVAVYQSKKGYKESAGVLYYGEVANYKTVKRWQIKEIIRQSDEPYLYIKIKKWHRLPKKIAADEMESIAFSTTLFLLKNSNKVSELHIRSKDEFELHKNLVKIVKNLVKTRTPSHDDIVYGDYTIKLEGGLLYLYFCDVVQYVIGYDVFLKTPMKVIKDIFEYYPEN